MSTCRLAQILLPVSAAYDPAILMCSRLCALAMHLRAQVKAMCMLGMSSRTIHPCTIRVDHFQRRWVQLMFPLPDPCPMSQK